MIEQNYFFWLGTIALIFLCIEERNLFKFGLGKDKKNYFMLGVAFSLLSHSPKSLSYLMAITILIVFLSISLKMLNLKDIQIGAITWVILGLSIYYFGYIVYISIIYLSMIGLAYIIRLLTKSNKEIPYIFLLLGSFVMFSLLIQAY